MKSTKVYLGEKRLKDVYVGATKWEVMKFRTARMVKRVLVTSLIVCTIGWGVAGGFYYAKSAIEPSVVFAEDRSLHLLNSKIDDLKDGVIEKLKKCESGGATEDDGLVTYDPLQSNPGATSKRNIPSFGSFQFKKDTVIHYFKMQTGKVLTPKEAVLLSLDDEKAGELVKYIAFETKNKIGKDWVNCNKKLNLDAQVDLIKSLSN